jgi:RNase P/RNase MRP subunit p30
VVRIAKWRNVVISSGARTPLDIRSLADVAALLQVVGVSAGNAGSITSANARRVLDHAGVMAATVSAFGCGCVTQWMWSCVVQSEDVRIAVL